MDLSDQYVYIDTVEKERSRFLGQPLESITMEKSVLIHSERNEIMVKSMLIICSLRSGNLSQVSDKLHTFFEIDHINMLMLVSYMLGQVNGLEL